MFDEMSSHNTPSTGVITPWGLYGFGCQTIVEGGTGNPSSTTWATANKARYYNISIPVPVVIDRLFWTNGSVATGTIDMAVYTVPGYTKIKSTGSITQAGTNNPQITTVTPFLLLPGRYMLGLASNSSSSTFFIFNAVNANNTTLFYQAFEETSAFNLPATATPVAQTSNFYLTVCGLIPYQTLF